MTHTGKGPEVKICGLRHADDVRVADDAGADYLGVILSAGFGRSVDPAAAAALVRGARATPVAVLVDESVAAAVARAEALGAGVVQLHGQEPPEVVVRIRNAGPWRVWKAVRARRIDDLRTAVDRYAGVVDAFLVEGWRDGVVGGGGARPGAEVAARAREFVPPDATFVLAGGLTPGSVADAVARFRPDVVDVSSGVEGRPGRKDPDAVRRFIREARRTSGTTPQARSETRA